MNPPLQRRTASHERSFADQVQELFHELADLEPDAQRTALQEADVPEDVRTEVGELFGWDRDKGDLLLSESKLRAACTSLLDATETRFAAAPRVGTKVGPFTLVEVLGTGRGGKVYRAEPEDPTTPDVALRVLEPGTHHAAVLARLVRLLPALRALDHPAVTQTLDAGGAANGQPYVVTELVTGESLPQHCDRHRLGITERLRLFLEVCEGIEHGHSHGVLHRNLSPANLRMTVRSGRVALKILDFGHTQASEQDSLEGILLTDHGIRIGRPAYRAPEQLLGEARRIDERADVFGLGAGLYELLSGTPPRPGRALRRVDRSSQEDALRRFAAPPPSAQIDAANGEVAARRGTSVAGLRRELEGDLDRIVLRALAPEPKRRYPSVEVFAGALRGHLERRRNDGPDVSRLATAD